MENEIKEITNEDSNNAKPEALKEIKNNIIDDLHKGESK